MNPLKIFAALSCGALTAWGGQMDLRYEWAPSPEGPYTAIPADQMKVQPDGSVSVETTAPRGFFRLLVNDGAASGGGASAPVRTLESLPVATRELLLRTITAISSDGSDEGGNWADARMAPFVTPVTSVWNETGEPDMVEIKMIADCPPPEEGGIFPLGEGERFSRDRGFILASLSRKNPPIVGYSTEGPTPCESLLVDCRSAPVKSVMRFGPMCLAAVGAAGDLLGQVGLLPAVYPDQAYADRAGPVSHEWSSEAAENPAMPPAPDRVSMLGFTSFRALVAGYNSSAWLKARRAQKEALIAFEWAALEGRAPTLEVAAGNTRSFLEGQTFVRYRLDDEDVARPVVVTLAAAGVTLQGVVPGAYRLTLYEASGIPSRYLVQVTSTGRVPRDGATGYCSHSFVWDAGTEAQQPRFSQRADLKRWCDSVGCGPTMLALMITWAEHNQKVPSAFWELTPNDPLAVRRASLRDIDAPMKYVKGVTNTRMRDWYDYLTDACDVACWPHNGSGSSLPWDVGSALGDYANNAASSFMPLIVAGDPGGPLVGANFHWEQDALGDDWDEAGVNLANTIKAGRPGGVYYMEHWHYAMAWRYRKTVYEFKVNNIVFSSSVARFFRVNTGWGVNSDKDAVWNAYDIDGCFLLNMWQKRQLSNP